jgi:hypothetical protein
MPARPDPRGTGGHLDRLGGMRTAIGPVVLTMLACAVLSACSAARPSVVSVTAATASPLPASSPSPATAPPPVSSPDPRLASIDAAQARWAAHRPDTYAFTFAFLNTSGVGWNWTDRVTSIDGHIETQAMEGLRPDGVATSRETVEGLFQTARDAVAADGEVRITFDRDIGYPTAIDFSTQASSDGDWTETVTDFVAGSDDTAARTQRILADARSEWHRSEPSAYEYTWRRFDGAGGPGSGTGWDVRREDGRTAIAPDPASDGALPAGAASVDATFAAVETALGAGAWVDLTIDSHSGLPVLVAIDPSATTGGDGSWTRIVYRNIEGEIARRDFDAARERWSAAGLQHYSYTWRYRGEGRPLTYGVTMDGDVAALKRGPGTPIPEALAYATPRIEETFQMIDEVLREGGRIRVTYDPTLGYPVRIVVGAPAESTEGGTFTITDFSIR